MTSPDLPTVVDLTDRPHRLDELVWHLSSCSPRAARAAITRRDCGTFDEAISAVASALVRVKRQGRIPAAV